MECEYEEEICEIVSEDPVYNKVYSSANRKRSSAVARRQEKAEKSTKRSSTLDSLVELHQQTRIESREYNDRLLAILERLVDSVTQ